MPTGVDGLDRMLHGGFPEGRIVLAAGEPGAGKTILGVQFLVKGVLEHGERGILVCLEESRHHLFKEMLSFGWELEEFEKSGKISFLDATPLRLLPSKIRVGDVFVDRKDFSISSLTQALQREVERLKPRRIVVDSITSLILQYHDVVQRRNALLNLMGTLASTQATCVMTSDLMFKSPYRKIEMEEFLAHGVIILQSIRIGSSMSRALQITKMRETLHDTQPRPYRITDKGVEVYPDELVLK